MHSKSKEIFQNAPLRPQISYCHEFHLRDMCHIVDLEIILCHIVDLEIILAIGLWLTVIVKGKMNHSDWQEERKRRKKKMGILQRQKRKSRIPRMARPHQFKPSTHHAFWNLLGKIPSYPRFKLNFAAHQEVSGKHQGKARKLTGSWFHAWGLVWI